MPGGQVVTREVPVYVEREVPVERVVTVEKRVEVPVDRVVEKVPGTRALARRRAQGTPGPISDPPLLAY